MWHGMLRYTCLFCVFKRNAITDNLSKLSVESDMRVKRLLQEKADLVETNEKLVKQLEELKDAIQHTKSGLRFLTAPEKGNYLIIIVMYCYVRVDAYHQGRYDDVVTSHFI